MMVQELSGALRKIGTEQAMKAAKAVEHRSDLFDACTLAYNGRRFDSILNGLDRHETFAHWMLSNHGQRVLQKMIDRRFRKLAPGYLELQKQHAALSLALKVHPLSATWCW